MSSRSNYLAGRNVAVASHTREKPRYKTYGYDTFSPTGLLVFIIACVALGFLIASVILPWYYVESGGKTTTYWWIEKETDRGSTTSYEDADDTQHLFAICFAFILGAILCTLILFLIAIGMICKNHFRDGFCKCFGFILAASAVALTVVAVGTFLDIPKALDEDNDCSGDQCDHFVGSEEDSSGNTTSEWGPHWGWIFAIISVPFNAAAVITVCCVGKIHATRSIKA